MGASIDAAMSRWVVGSSAGRRFGGFYEEAGEGEAGFFAAGQDDGLVDIVLAEEKRARDRAGLLLGELVFGRAQLHDVFEHRPRRHGGCPCGFGRSNR